MGKLMVFEGLDGSGKGTQANILSAYLSSNKIPFKSVSFPNYNEPSSALIKMYLNGEFGSTADSVNAYAASAFYAVDRFSGYIKNWKNDYSMGKLIIADRYTTSNAVHQTGKLPKTQWDEYLSWLYEFEFEKMDIPRPDLVLYFDMDPIISQRLISERYNGDEQKKDLHEKDIEYLLHCRTAALYAAKKFGWKIITCFAENEPLLVDEIAEKVLDEAKKLIF